MSGVKAILSLAFSKERVESMKVLMLNGSAKKEGNTYQSLLEVGKELERQGIEYEIFQIGSQPVRDCIGCGQCNENGCVFADDKVNEFVAKAKEADGFVFGTPVYYAHPSGRILSFLDRVFYSSGRAFAFKPAASVAVARRGGCSASFDVMNKYYGICQMPVAGSTYWNMVHGCEPGEVKMDAEGMQTMRNLAKNLAWMMKCFEAGKVAGIIAAIYQSVFGQDAYPSVEEKAANLLYFMIKDHPYADGCKRIAASLFLEFLDKNNVLFLDGEKRLSDGTLVAITLMIAESKADEKEIMIKLVMNLLKL